MRTDKRRINRQTVRKTDGRTDGRTPIEEQFTALANRFKRKEKKLTDTQTKAIYKHRASSIIGKNNIYPFYADVYAF